MLESASLIKDLNSAAPADGDQRSEGAAHFRMVKGVLQNQFPNLEGQVTATAGNLNNPLLATPLPPVPGQGETQTITLPYYTTNATASTCTFTPYARDTLFNLANAAALTTTIGLDGYVLKTGSTMTGTLGTTRVFLTGNGTTETTGFTLYVDAGGRQVFQASAGNAILFDGTSWQFTIGGTTVAKVAANAISSAGNVKGGGV